jgi:hypothetical protein
LGAETKKRFLVVRSEKENDCQKLIFLTNFTKKVNLRVFFLEFHRTEAHKGLVTIFIEYSDLLFTFLNTKHKEIYPATTYVFLNLHVIL